MTTAMKALRGAVAAVAALAFAGAVGAAELEARSSSAAGVTVKVTPKDVAPGSGTWAFTVVLDTHSRNLSDDLVRDSVLIDARGTRYAPIAWEGPPPGGHHRQGVLRFKALGPAPGAFELQIGDEGARGVRRLSDQTEARRCEP